MALNDWIQQAAPQGTQPKSVAVSTGLSGWINAAKPRPQVPLSKEPPVYSIPSLPSNTQGSTPQTADTEGINSFLAEVAGGPLSRAGLPVALDIQKIFTGSTPAPIQTKQELGDYAASFLGEDPITSLSQKYREARAGGARILGDSFANDLVSLIGVTGEAALNLLPFYGTLADEVASLLGRKFVTKAVQDLSIPGEVNIRKFKPLEVAGSSQETPINLYQGYKPDSELPTIPFGAKGKSTLPTIQIGDKALTTEYKYVPLGNGLELPIRVAEVPKGETLYTIPGTNIEIPKILQGDISKGALDAQRLGIKSGLGVIPDSALSRTTPITFADQERRIQEIVDDGVERIRKIATGSQALPGGIEPTAFYNAAIHFAEQNGDFELLKTLARSDLGATSSRVGRSLGATRLFKDEFAVDKVIRDLGEIKKTSRGIKDSMIKAEKAATKNEVVKAIARGIDDSSWGSFIDDITC